MAAHAPTRAGVRESAEGVEGLRGVLGSSKLRQGEGRGTWRGGARAVLSMATTGHCIEHVVYGEVAKVGAELGWLRADLDLGP